MCEPELFSQFLMEYCDLLVAFDLFDKTVFFEESHLEKEL